MNKPVTVYTAEEWVARLREAADLAEKLLPKFVAAADGPGPIVLASMMIARAVCEAYPPLPAFEWYARIVRELPVPSLPSTPRPKGTH